MAYNNDLFNGGNGSPVVPGPMFSAGPQIPEGPQFSRAAQVLPGTHPHFLPRPPVFSVAAQQHVTPSSTLAAGSALPPLLPYNLGPRQPPFSGYAHLSQPGSLACATPPLPSSDFLRLQKRYRGLVSAFRDSDTRLESSSIPTAAGSAQSALTPMYNSDTSVRRFHGAGQPLQTPGTQWNASASRQASAVSYSSGRMVDHGTVVQGSSKNPAWLPQEDGDCSAPASKRKRSTNAPVVVEDGQGDIFRHFEDSKQEVKKRGKNVPQAMKERGSFQGTEVPCTWNAADPNQPKCRFATSNPGDMWPHIREAHQDTIQYLTRDGQPLDIPPGQKPSDQTNVRCLIAHPTKRDKSGRRLVCNSTPQVKTMALRVRTGHIVKQHMLPWMSHSDAPQKTDGQPGTVSAPTPVAVPTTEPSAPLPSASTPPQKEPELPGETQQDQPNVVASLLDENTAATSSEPPGGESPPLEHAVPHEATSVSEHKPETNNDSLASTSPNQEAPVVDDVDRSERYQQAKEFLMTFLPYLLLDSNDNPHQEVPVADDLSSNVDRTERYQRAEALARAVLPALLQEDLFDSNGNPPAGSACSDAPASSDSEDCKETRDENPNDGLGSVSSSESPNAASGDGEGKSGETQSDGEVGESSVEKNDGEGKEPEKSLATQMTSKKRKRD
ncbi:hypothetical protein CC1G_05643 [Coprinopsis cinerea okayama7|uniref:Uncharacterized protein n=1 Tax=Coprinopsis cinerea (strain Okayama-7 / 130 / ATCC MYA-4618 / FGSC 9003) TaxID=240176 RepID=A8P1R9_COPC7|nr:hypothetical protein CC1G_05643 [Coprinopsis cinerea okayama7\|eukprot:XP_001838162.2 hypothetical protein CC1G_05643 [Coprinopsis cinerea okayama7\